MSSLSNLHKLLQRIQTDYPDITFVKSSKSSWDAKKMAVSYNANETTNPIWSLLHELGHMNAGHNRYSSDIELLMMESEAWKAAKELGQTYGYVIDNDYIEDCLDSYRDWLHARSSCPSCKQSGIEKQTGHYSCINCGKTWDVSSSRFCRVYRQTKTPQK